jgi:hypothetical protein
MKKYPEYEYEFYFIGSSIFRINFRSLIRDSDSGSVIYKDSFEFAFDDAADLTKTILDASRQYNIILKKQYEEYID